MILNKQQHYLSFIKYILVIAFGALGFSQLGYLVTVEVMQLPIYLPEIFYIFGGIAWLLSNDKITTIIRPITFIVFLILSLFWLSLVLLGAMEGEFIDALSGGRAILYSIIAAFLAGSILTVKNKTIYFFLFGIILGELINGEYLKMYSSDFRGIVPVNLIAVYSFMALSVFIKNKAIFFVSMVLLLPLIMISGFRVTIAAAVLGLLVPYFIIFVRANVIGKFYTTIKLFLSILLAGVSAIVILQAININAFAYFRIVNRTLALLRGNIEQSQDGERITKYLDKLEAPGNILPSGFVVETMEKVGDFNDVPFLNFTITLGVPLGVVVILLLFIVGGLSFFKIIIERHSRFNPVELTAGSFFVCWIFLFLINGRFMYITYESIMFGAYVGMWFKSFKLIPLKKLLY